MIEHEEQIASPVQVSGTVHLGHTVVNHAEAADFGSYTTYGLVGTEAPFRLLAHDNNRKRAVIAIDSNSVYIGKKEQVFSSQPGYKLSSGMPPLVIENKQEVWITPNALSCNVSVLNERWAE